MMIMCLQHQKNGVWYIPHRVNGIDTRKGPFQASLHKKKKKNCESIAHGQKKHYLLNHLCQIPWQTDMLMAHFYPGFELRDSGYLRGLQHG